MYSIINSTNRQHRAVAHDPAVSHGSPGRIKLWAQVITGLESDDLTAVHVLDAATWQQRRQRLQDLGGPPEQ